MLSSGTNVQYPNGKTTRASLAASDVLTVAEIKKAVRTLKGNKAKKLKGNRYVAIIHTDIAHDLTNDPEWKFPHQYVDTKQIYEGEIGELYIMTIPRRVRVMLNIWKRVYARTTKRASAYIHRATPKRTSRLLTTFSVQGLTGKRITASRKATAYLSRA